MNPAYEELMKLLRERAALSSIAGLLGWDQETGMPPKAARFRAEEQSTLAALTHRKATHPRVGELLEACEADGALTADPAVAANLRELRRDYDRALKLPVELVAEMSETGTLAMEAWKTARKSSDFAGFRPWLDKQLRLARTKAECLGFPEDGELYDALIEDYEPDMTAAEVKRIFAPLREELTPLIEAIAASGVRPDQGPLTVELPIERQLAFSLAVVQQVGFDLGAGRLDTSTHPFSTGLGPGDTRITTRFRKDQFVDALGSTLHETGHGLYEQGLPKAEYLGQPLSEPVGLGIHESQSRMWENHVGRSRSFWQWALPEARRMLGPGLDGFSVDDLYRASNTVRPHLIRVESDEATYNLHIMLRFDLELAMLRGDLATDDLPGAWNERMRSDLGLEVPDDRRGCLQDVHWSMGAIGYFPTYTLGNLHAAQMWEAVTEARPGLDGEIARGELGTLLTFLRENVHAHGRRYSSTELCRRISGRPLTHGPLMRHLNGKLREIYGLNAKAEG